MTRPSDLIKRYSTALVEGLVSIIAASSPIHHKLTKGELRELFVTNLLLPFLTKQFDAGTGIVINQKEEQSYQTDIIIYDNRILPPFIKEQHIGVYPAESVVGTIEVKTKLTKEALLKAEASARRLHEAIYNPSSNIFGMQYSLPVCGVIAFEGAAFLNQKKNKSFLEANCTHILFICRIGKSSWIKLGERGWSFSENNENYEETKRFIAVFLDNLRTISELRISELSQFAHKDWLSVYIRDQKLFDR
ncbi:MAG: DUF6602 domain-containing protein [Syntrophobacteraceae bacterium]